MIDTARPTGRTLAPSATQDHLSDSHQAMLPPVGHPQIEWPRAPEAKKCCTGLPDEAQLAGQHIDRANLK